MRDRALRRLAHVVLTYPKRVIAVGVLLTILCVIVSAGLTLRPSRLDLLPPDEPALARYKSIIDEFGGPNSILLVFEGPPEQIQPAMTALAHDLEGLKEWIRAVTWRITPDHLVNLGLYCKSPEELSDLRLDLIELAYLLRTLASDPTAARFLDTISDELEDEDAGYGEIEEVQSKMEFILNALSVLDRHLAAGSQASGSSGGDDRIFERLRLKVPKSSGMPLDDDGRMVAGGGRLGLMVLSPARRIDKNSETRPFFHEFDPLTLGVEEKFPGIKIHRAGSPIRNQEEEESVRGDLRLTSAVAGILVFFVSLWAYGSLVPAVVIVITLLMVVAIMMGATWLLIGHLNLVTTVFVAILFGLGHDFGNYVILLAREWWPERGPAGIGDALVTAGSSLATAALTTAVAFLSLLFHDLPAYQELGLIAGIGVLIAFVAMLTVLPAALSLWWYPQSLVTPRNDADSKAGAGTKACTGTKACATLPMRSYSFVICIIFALIMAWALPRCLEIPFDYDLRNLLPAGGETAKSEQLLLDEFHISPDFNVIAAGSIDEARTIEEHLVAQPAVGTIDSVMRWIPPDANARAAWVAGVLEVVESIPPVVEKGRPYGDLESRLKRLRRGLEKPRELGEMEENANLNVTLQRLDGLIGGMILRLEKISESDCAAARIAYSIRMARELSDFTSRLRKGASLPPPTVETLPPEIRNRYVGSKGSVLLFVSPRGDLSTFEGARAFDQACFGTSHSATGIPALSYHTIENVRRGWRKSSFWGFLAILLMLLLDFRSILDVVLALIPLAWATSILVAGMSLFAIPMNAFSCLSVPLLLGIGIDYGVNFLHRYHREHSLEIAWRSTGLAIFVSALTTICGFGSLTLANHRGLSSFGASLGTGVALSALAALVLLPAILALRPDR